MNDEQFKQLLEILGAKPKRSLATTEFAIVDMLQKVAVVVIAAGMIWLVGSVSDMQRSIDVIQVNQNANKAEISDFKDFTKKPRFSFDDFANHMAPIKQRLEQNEYKLRERSDWMNVTSERVSKLESKYEIILEKLSTMNSDVAVIRKSITKHN